MLRPKYSNISQDTLNNTNINLSTTANIDGFFSDSSLDDKYRVNQDIDNDATISPKEKKSLKAEIARQEELQKEGSGSNKLSLSDNYFKGVGEGMKLAINTMYRIAVNPYTPTDLIGPNIQKSYSELADNAKLALKESKQIKFLQKNPNYILKDRKTGLDITAKEFLDNTKSSNFIESLFGLVDSPIEGKKLTMDKSAFYKTAAGIDIKNKGLSGSQRMLYSYKDEKTGKDELGLVEYDDIKQVEEIGGKVISAYGPKKFSKGVGENLWEGLGTTLVGTPKLILNAASSASIISSSIANFVSKGEFKHDPNMFTSLSDELDNYAKIYKNESSYSADENSFGIESLGRGVGAGIGSLIQFGVIGRVARGLALGGEALAARAVGLEAGGLLGTSTTTANIVTNISSKASQAKLKFDGVLGGTKAMDFIINMGAGAVLNHGEAYDAAKEAGMSPENRALFATSVGLINSLVESSIGANRVMNYLSGGEGKALNRGMLKSLQEVIGKDLSKVTSRELANGIDKAGKSMFNTVTDAITRFTEREVIGTMAEEAGEEAIQTLISKAAESLYDAHIAPHTENKKEFGTEFFSGETLKETLQAALIGGLVGGVSGLALERFNKTANKIKGRKDSNILEYIVSGDTDKVQAMVSKLYDSGYITENQRNETRDRLNVLDKIYSKNSQLFDALQSKTPEESNKLKATAFNLTNVIKEVDTDINDINTKIQEINNDKELLPELKKTRIDALKLSLEKNLFKKQFLNDELDRYITPVNGKIDAVENSAINDTINDRFKESFNQKIIKDINTQITSIDNIINILSTENENLETSDVKYKENLKKIEDLKNYRKNFENKIAELENPVIIPEPPVVPEPALNPVLNTTSTPNTSEEPLNEPINSNNNSDIEQLLNDIEDNEKLLEDPDIDDENKQAIQENINDLNNQLKILTDVADEEIANTDSFLNKAIEDIDAIDKNTTQSNLDKKQDLETIKEGLLAKIKANQKLGIKDNSSYQFVIDYIDDSLKTINDKLDKIANETALAEQAAKKEAAKPKPADASTDVFATESFFSAVYRTPGLLNNPNTMSLEELNDLLINTPIEQLLAGISLRFSNEFVKPGTVRSKTKNSIVKFVDPVWNVQVMYNGKIIGLLPESTKIMIGDTIVDWNTITQEEFNNHLSKTANFERTIKLLNDLQKLEALHEVVDLNLEDLASLGIKINVTNGGFQVLPVADRLSVRDLEKAKLDALNGGYYIYDRTNNTFITDSSVNMITQEGVPSIPDNLTERYVVLTQTGDGKYRWVSAQQPEFSNDKIIALQKEINDSIAQIEADPENTELLTKLNKQINDKVFITGEVNENKQFVLTKPQKGKVKLLLKIDTKGSGAKSVTIELNPAKIGTSIKGERVLSKSNLREPLDKNITNESEALDNLKVNVGQDIVVNPQLNITFDTDALNDFQAGIIIADNEEIDSVSPEVADIERRRQEDLEKKVQILKDKRNALRGEDGVVPKENIAEWQQLGKDVIEAQNKATRGNNEGFIPIRTEKDGVLSGEDAINAENEIERVIQKIIKGEITIEQAVSFIHNKYKVLANENGFLLNYINDRTSNAPEIGNNKQSFPAWRKGKYDAEQQESIIDEKTLKGFSSEEDLAKAFGVKPLEQSKNLEELTKEELWKELVDLGYDSYESLEEYESFIKDFGIKGTIEETLIQTIKNNKTGEKDSFIDLSLNKILKDNNITKNC